MKTFFKLTFLFLISSFSFSQENEDIWDYKLKFKSKGQIMYKAKGKLSFEDIKSNSVDSSVTMIDENINILVDRYSQNDFIVIQENDITVLQRLIYGFEQKPNEDKFYYTGYQWEGGLIKQEYDIDFIYTKNLSKNPCKYFYDKIENLTILIEYIAVK
jgi:hypothetical protein